MSMVRVGAVLFGLWFTYGSTSCSGGGGGGSNRSATPTLPAPTKTATVRPTPAAALSLSGVFPLIGSGDGGTPVVIEGAGFADGGPVEVFFGEAPATNVIVIDDRKLSALIPPGERGSAVSVEASSAKGTDRLDGAFRYGGGGASSTLAIELTGEPSVAFDQSIGTTTVVLDYLVRDSEGDLLDESDLDVRMFVNDQELGAGGPFGESVLDSDAQQLDLSVFIELVLDASFSLEQFDPPQFDSMLKAAENLVSEGTDIWRDRGGSFDWSVVWFDELLSQPDPDHLRSFRIGNIPQPAPGNFTKLYSAVSNALEVSASRFAEGVAAGERDRHVLVVFTDGLDNLSSFDNPDVRLEGQLRNGDPYPRIGWRATGLDDVLAEIGSHPRYPTNLTVHTIALGRNCAGGGQGEPCFDEQALRDVAQVGFGQLLVSPRDVDDLFDQIRREFTELQSSGAVMALPPGDYEFRLLAESRNGRASGEVRFRFRVGTDGAELISF